jgi:hypothetical protein
MSDEPLRKIRNIIIEAIDEIGITLQNLKVSLANQDLPAEHSPDLAKLSWRTAQGRQGPFEIAINNQASTYKELATYVANHDFCSLQGYSLWILKDGSIARRKQSHLSESLPV